MGKNKGKKYKSNVDMLCFAPITNIDYDKLDADPNDETAYTYGSWIRARGAEEIRLDSQFASQNIPADGNKNYIVMKKNNGYAGSVRLTTLPPEFFTDICLMTDFIEDDETIPLAFAVGYEYKEEGKKCRRILWHNELTQLPGINHTTESGDLAIDDDTINITSLPREGNHKITAVCTEGDPVFADFFSAVPQPSAFVTPGVTLSGPDEVDIDEMIVLTAATAPVGTALTWTSSDTTKATVQNGIVTGKVSGEVTITAAFTSDSSIKATKTITVNS